MDCSSAGAASGQAGFRTGPSPKRTEGPGARRRPPSSDTRGGRRALRGERASEGDASPETPGAERGERRRAPPQGVGGKLDGKLGDEGRTVHGGSPRTTTRRAGSRGNGIAAFASRDTLEQNVPQAFE